MFPKILEYEPFFERTGEPRLQIIEPRNRAMVKHASADLQDYLATVRPCPGKRYVLVLAMSASEYYGPNRNGDAFAERPVKVRGAWAVAPGETLVDHYKTFETHAHVYRHHINKDPAKSFGRVVKAFYNHHMHRVELLLEVDEAAGSDIVQKIDAGEFPGVSMGCRIKYDVCDICGNRAPTRMEYCDHVSGSNPEFGMNQLLPDGRRCFVWNPAPTLFDISFVFKPADRIGYMMKKVASAEPYEVRPSAWLGEKVAALQSKRAALLKLSDIDKVVSGDVVSHDSLRGLNPAEYLAAVRLVRGGLGEAAGMSPELDDATVAFLSAFPFSDVLSSMSHCHMLPTARETYRIFSAKNGVPAFPEIGDRVAGIQGILAEVLSEVPHILDAIADLGILSNDPRRVRIEIVQTLAPYTEKRALWEDVLARKYIPEAAGGVIGETTGLVNPDNAYYGTTRQLLTYTDPSSGKAYQTTRRAAERASYEEVKRRAVEAAGVAGVGALGVKAVASSPKWRWATPGAAVGAVGGGYEVTRKLKTPGVVTDDGIEVPSTTEFVEKKSAYGTRVGIPLAGSALATYLLAQDYANNDHGGVRGTLGQWAYDSPVKTTAGLALAAGAAVAGGSRAFGAMSKTASKHQLRTALFGREGHKYASPSELSPVDAKALIYRLGQFIVSMR